MFVWNPLTELKKMLMLRSFPPVNKMALRILYDRNVHFFKENIIINTLNLKLIFCCSSFTG